MEVKKTLKLRPHHLLCIQAFKGLGYDENFIRRMGKVKSLFNDESQKIEITIGSDYICEACPNLQDRRCAKGGSDAYLRMEKRDLMVCDALNLDLKRIYKVNEILKILKETLDKDSIKLLCSDCEWFEKAGCYETLIK